MKYDAILFDADDTIFDFRAAERYAIEEVLAELGAVDPGAPAVYSAINAACWRDLEKGIITQAELKVRRFRELIRLYALDSEPEELAERYEVALSEQSVMLPHALEVVSEVAAARPIALVTNGISFVQRGRMEHSPIAPLLSAFIISEEVGHTKPEPEIFAAALEALGGVHPARALMIGDSLTSDVAGANAAGIDVCWYNPGRKTRPAGVKIDYEIDDIRDVVHIALS